MKSYSNHLLSNKNCQRIFQGSSFPYWPCILATVKQINKPPQNQNASSCYFSTASFPRKHVVRTMEGDSWGYKAVSDCCYRYQPWRQQSVQEWEDLTKSPNRLPCASTSTISICATGQQFSHSMWVFMPSNHRNPENACLGFLWQLMDESWASLKHNLLHLLKRQN